MEQRWISPLFEDFSTPTFDGFIFHQDATPTHGACIPWDNYAPTCKYRIVGELAWF